MSFTLHPTSKLVESFRQKPYQGANPLTAKFLFIGLDANYAADIAEQPIFNELLNYHADGVSFWKKYNCHHPFLLTGYRGDGKKYHQRFAKIGFNSQHAAQVSFIELLDIPTVGRNTLEHTDFNPAHLKRIKQAILDGEAQHIFISPTVFKYMKQCAEFRWLPKKPAFSDAADSLKILYQQEAKTIYLHLHFSNYGKFEQQLLKEAAAIRQLIAGI